MDAIETKKSPNPVGLKLNKTVYLKVGIASKGLYSGSTGPVGDKLFMHKGQTVITGGFSLNGFQLSWLFGGISIIVSTLNMLQALVNE